MSLKEIFTNVGNVESVESFKERVVIKGDGLILNELGKQLQKEGILWSLYGSWFINAKTLQKESLL